MSTRVPEGVLHAHHRQLVKLAELTGQTVTALLDRAIKNLLEDEAPVLRLAAQKLNGRRPGKRPIEHAAA